MLFVWVYPEKMCVVVFVCVVLCLSWGVCVWRVTKQPSKHALHQTITTSFRDRRLQACLWTDASSDGWAYAITQCQPGELDKPWQQQHR